MSDKKKFSKKKGASVITPTPPQIMNPSLAPVKAKKLAGKKGDSKQKVKKN